MNETYDHHAIEARWRARWQAEGRGRVDLDAARRPFYNLMEFPYPSGEGLHVGHVFSFGGADSYGRFMRRRGYDVFQPIGYDAFGIHSENYALKIGAHPAELTPRSVARFREQLGRLGAAFDWSRTVDTTAPSYYRWTQWIFLQLYRAGLAYRAEASVNWCPSCMTVLANEQVIDGRCERCDTPMTRRSLAQWFFRITRYADRLLDFSAVDFSEAVVRRQQAWIGRSEGREIDFPIVSGDGREPGVVTIFTTRPETIRGATFVALAPEHPLSAALAAANGPEAAAIRAYLEQTRGRLALERQQREPEGVFSGAAAINPATGERVPIWIADYVLPEYGSGAIMGVPAEDERDRRFAARYGLPIVDAGGDPPAEIGRPAVRYRLRDWLISRQRYWGPPIPIVYCDACGTVPVPESDLPVLLPPLESFRPLNSGVAPLATDESFVATTCPSCGGPARRETDVSDTFLDSAWYFLRYLSTEYDDQPWDCGRVARWLPVALYTGGQEHATMHHLYARFLSLALHDLGLTPVAEPFGRLRLHGTITHGGRKMSKSRGNVVNPDAYIERYGADATRMALLFLGPFEQDTDFSDRGVVGMARFLGRVWELCLAGQPAEAPAAGADEAEARMSEATAQVTDGLESRQFHTAIAALMSFAGWLRGVRLPGEAFAAARRRLVELLAPFAPYIAAELWDRIGGDGSVHDAPWPEAAAVAVTEAELPVQVDGRLRGRVRVAAAADQATVRAAALAAPGVAEAIAGRAVRRVIVVPGRIVNIVTD